MRFLNFFRRKVLRPDTANEAPQDYLMSEVMAKYPSGPIRRGSLKGVARHLDLKDSEPVIDEILIFDADDHWFCVFLGCRPLGLPFELSFRFAKRSDEDTPPDWFVEPVTRVANGIGDGALCAPGITWKIGAPLDGPDSAYFGFLTLPDLEFGLLEPDCLLQLVPVSNDELSVHGNDHKQLCDRIEKDRSRMIGGK